MYSIDFFVLYLGISLSYSTALYFHYFVRYLLFNFTTIYYLSYLNFSCSLLRIAASEPTWHYQIIKWFNLIADKDKYTKNTIQVYFYFW